MHESLLLHLPSLLSLFWPTVFLVTVALFINGATDSPSSVATVIATGALSPRAALLGAGVCNLIGTLFGAKVAITITSGIISLDLVKPATIFAAMVAIIGWGTFAWTQGKPISKSHALIAGLAGAGFASGGFDAYTEVWRTQGWWNGWTKVLTGLVFSPVLGFGGGLMLGKIIIRFCSGLSPETGSWWFDRLQVVSAGLQATTHGRNDGPKFAGVFMLLAVTSGVVTLGPHGEMPPEIEYVLLFCAVVIGLGTYFGGKRIIVKVGKKLGEGIVSWQGFAAEMSSATVIFFASSLGIPISTTHVVVPAIAGTHAAVRLANVNKHVAIEILKGWVYTFPICWVLSYLASVIVLYAQAHL